MKKGKTYVFTDLHGQYKLWEQIKAYLKPEDKAYCLGDCVDRGPHGIKILSEIMADSRITLLKGNHEDMMFSALDLYVHSGSISNFSLWMGNGGKATWKSVEDWSEDKLISLCARLRKLPTRVDLVNAEGKKIILTHAGIDPWVTDEEAQDMEKIYRVHPYIWDRDHIFSTWSKEYDDTYIIHGHTPVISHYFGKAYFDSSTPTEQVKIERYAEGHKINLDLGAFVSGKVALLDIDTLKEIYFEAEVE